MIVDPCPRCGWCNKWTASQSRATAQHEHDRRCQSAAFGAVSDSIRTIAAAAWEEGVKAAFKAGPWVDIENDNPYRDQS
jgi:hypothetical protein